MRVFSSLTARLSILFGIVMIGTWLIACLLLVHALGLHFSQQNDKDIHGKLQLTKNFLLMQNQTGYIDWLVLNRQIDDALAGHHDLFIIITDTNNKVLVYSRSSSKLNPPGLDVVAKYYQPPHISEQDDYLRSQVLNVTIGKSDSRQQVIIRVILNTQYHQFFIHEMKAWLSWFTGGLALASLFLGWIASRLGLKPLHDLARVSTSITADKLDQRLSLESTPRELHAPILSFNTMLDRLEQSFRRISEFSSDIAHELRTPVSNLMMQTQVALGKERSADDYREVLYSSLEEYERLARMISDMLFLAKSEHGLLSLQQDKLDLAQEVDDLLEFFEPLASDKHVRIMRQGNAQLRGDRLMIRRTFSNLLSNAIRHTPSNSKIYVHIGSSATEIEVSVSNPGSPIPASQLPRLFDRFYRGDSARQHQTEGTGLGLAITRSIIEAHGGSLFVTSDERLTVFTCRFPLDEAFS